jgi:uncharacterized membrane protein
VVAIDRLSIVFVVILAAAFLSETISWRTGIGALIMVLGAILVSVPDGKITRLWLDFVRLLK